jgi:hypothetical protein
MCDRTDDLIEALVRARERGASRDECVALVRDVFRAPWSDDVSAKMDFPEALLEGFEDGAPRPELRDRRIPYDDADSGDRDLPETRDRSAFDHDTIDEDEAGL